MFFWSILIGGKKILIGITGSIAAYKTASLIRLLKKAGAEVKVVMTPAATAFITPLTLATLAEHPVYSDFTEDKDAGTWTNHVALGMWADLMLIAPLSANTLGKMANGVCDNFLLATYLSAKCPVMLAPAMDLDMYQHPSTQSNLEKLRHFGHVLIDAEEGFLASGLEGKGRMAEPEHIRDAVLLHFVPNSLLYKKKVLITAGPTYEKIDPVRFIGNFSSGKMGYALAEAMSKQGAEVSLISGPTHLRCASDEVKITRVTSAQEMFDACTKLQESQDIIIMSAAVADYRPAAQASEKLKKKEDHLSLQLEATPDILATMGARKRPGQILVGFALETENEIENAQVKIEKKQLDFIVLNSLKDAGAGFGFDTNKVRFIFPDNKILSFGLKSKAAVANDITEQIISLLKNED